MKVSSSAYICSCVIIKLPPALVIPDGSSGGLNHRRGGGGYPPRIMVTGECLRHHVCDIETGELMGAVRKFLTLPVLSCSVKL